MIQSYSQFPPLSSFKKVLQSIPGSGLLYAYMWSKRDKACSRSAFSKTKIKKMFLVSQTLFRNHLIALSRLEVVAFEETPEFFLIDFCDTYEN